MTQDERWQKRYNEVKSFIETNHRNPSRHRIEEHDMLNWVKHTKKMIEKEGYPSDRIEKFKTLLELADKYRRVNQYE